MSSDAKQQRDQPMPQHHHTAVPRAAQTSRAVVTNKIQARAVGAGRVQTVQRTRQSRSCLEASAAVAAIQPTDIYAYVDKVQVWMKWPLTKSQITDLKRRRALCHGYVHVKTVWDRARSCKQRLQLCQPPLDVLRWLAAHEHIVNQVEVALDWTFDDADHRDFAFETLQRYLIKKYHGNQSIRVVAREREGKLSKGSTWYSGQRWKNPTVLAIYAHRPCKVTGEVHCVHMEWRMYGVNALRGRRTGIHSLYDLKTLDCREFWRRRLLLATLDHAKFGRLWRRHGQPNRPRLSNMDATTGRTLIRACYDMSTQNVIDHYRLPQTYRCLNWIPVDHLLPASAQDSSMIMHPNRPKSQKPARLRL